jgi:flavin reductase (DIM6/NTAB) family NADH-FMN oxidoreductase RutF
MSSPQTIDRDRFCRIIGSFPTGVCVVTTIDHDGTPRGLTTNAISSVSADSGLLLICVDRTSRTLPALLSARKFLVNFMGIGGSHIARVFASKAENKFESVEWNPEPVTGLPLFSRHAVAWAACVTVEEIDAADHVIFLGRTVAGSAAREESPAVYYNRTYGVWTPAVAE